MLTKEETFKLAKGTYFVQRLCTCDTYRAKYVCKDCHVRHPLQVCEPPPCMHCDKWPRHPLRVCASCNKVYYRWFQFPLLLSNPNPRLQYCWPCSNKLAGEAEKRIKVRLPPDCVIPPKLSVDELQARMDEIFKKLRG